MYGYVWTNWKSGKVENCKSGEMEKWRNGKVENQDISQVEK